VYILIYKKKMSCALLADSVLSFPPTPQSNATKTKQWTETKRDFENYAKRKGDLPLQKEGETVDFRNVLHR
jgi:hypothetical protein